MNDINNKEQSSKWIKCLEMALYFKPRNVETQIKVATILYEPTHKNSSPPFMNDIKWIKCLEMALYFKPQDAEEQVKIATNLYESGETYDGETCGPSYSAPIVGETCDSRNKTILQKVLDKIKN